MKFSTFVSVKKSVAGAMRDFHALLFQNTSDALHLNPVTEFHLEINQKKQFGTPGSWTPTNKGNHFRLEKVTFLLPRHIKIGGYLFSLIVFKVSLIVLLGLKSLPNFESCQIILYIFMIVPTSFPIIILFSTCKMME